MAGLISEHGGNIYKARRRLGIETVDFSASINPLGLPDYIKKLMYQNFDDILHYPDPDAECLTKEIARYWDIKEENILVGNGSIELIYLIASALRPRTALIASPDFSEYERALSLAGSRLSFLKLTENNGFKIDLSRIGSSDILFFSNPNNPTGSMVVTARDRIEKLPIKTVVVDEAFMDFVADEDIYTMIHKAVKYKKIIVLRTFTKFFSLPGLRAGYIVAHKDIVRLLKRHQAPWSVNVLAQTASARMLSDNVYMDATRSLVEKERNFLMKELGAVMGVRPFTSVVNFILIKIEVRGYTSRYVTDELFHKGILVRNCANFRNLKGQFIRVAVRKREENIRLIKAIKDIFKR